MTLTTRTFQSNQQTLVSKTTDHGTVTNWYLTYWAKLELHVTIKI